MGEIIVEEDEMPVGSVDLMVLVPSLSTLLKADSLFDSL
jgi:hypothetical protein